MPTSTGTILLLPSFSLFFLVTQRAGTGAHANTNYLNFNFVVVVYDYSTIRYLHRIYWYAGLSFRYAVLVQYSSSAALRVALVDHCYIYCYLFI